MFMLYLDSKKKRKLNTKVTILRTKAYTTIGRERRGRIPLPLFIGVQGPCEDAQFCLHTWTAYLYRVHYMTLNDYFIFFIFLFF